MRKITDRTRSHDHPPPGRAVTACRRPTISSASSNTCILSVGACPQSVGLPEGARRGGRGSELRPQARSLPFGMASESAGACAATGRSPRGRDPRSSALARHNELSWGDGRARPAGQGASCGAEECTARADGSDGQPSTASQAQLLRHVPCQTRALRWDIGGLRGGLLSLPVPPRRSRDSTRRGAAAERRDDPAHPLFGREPELHFPPGRCHGPRKLAQQGRQP